MKKALLFLLGLVLVSPAFASNRTDGMGILPIQDNDIDLIWVFPQAAADYAVVDYRLGYDGTGDNWGGIIHTDKYLGNYGVYIGRPFQGAQYADVNYIDGVTGSSIFDGLGTWRTRLEYGVYHSPYQTNTWWGGNLTTNNLVGNVGRMPENKFDFFKTAKMGNGTLGICVNYAAEKNGGNYTAEDSQAAEQPIDKSGTHVLGLKVGYGVKNVGPFNNFDLSVGYKIASANDTGTSSHWTGTEMVPTEIDTFKSNGIHEMTVNLRGVKEVSDSTKLVTNVVYMSNKLGLIMTSVEDPNWDGTSGDNEGNNISSDATMTTTNIMLGQNCVHKVHDGMGKVVAGVNLQYNKAKWSHNEMYNLAGSETADQIWDGDYSGSTYERSWLGAWANIGVEANVLKWLQFRGGISKAIIGVTKSKTVYPYDYSGTNNAPQETTTYSYSWEDTNSVVTTIGAGVVYKNWNIDLLYDANDIERLLRNPQPGSGIAYAPAPGNGLFGMGAAKVEIRYNL